MSALDNLNALNSLVEKKEKVEKKDERPEMAVPPAVLKAFQRLVPALKIIEVAEARKKIEGTLISEELMGVYAETLFNQGSRPTNPRLVVNDKNNRPDLSGLFQVQEKWKLQYEKGETSIASRIAAALVKAGFDQAAADKLVAAEINCQPLTVIRPLNELAVGTPIEKSAAEKVIALAMGQPALPFTAEERAVALTKIEVTEVRDGFLERVKLYVKDANQLKMLFKVITPVNFVSHAKYGISDTEEGRVQRLALEGQQLILGTKVPDKK